MLVVRVKPLPAALFYVVPRLCLSMVAAVKICYNSKTDIILSQFHSDSQGLGLCRTVVQDEATRERG